MGAYLPGYKAGGPIRSIANLIERLGDDYQFYILASDRDIGDREPYSGITPGVWTTQGKAQVLYLPAVAQTLYGYYRLLRTLSYDIVYLNSCFYRGTINILLLRRLGLIPTVPVVLAPRGEFAHSAMALKAYKKYLYLAASNYMGFYQGIRWQVSSTYEAEDVHKRIIRLPSVSRGSPITVHITPDLVATTGHSIVKNRRAKTRGELHIVFLARISPMKNLDFALKLLGNVKSHIYFDIYGPLEDQAYWHECQSLIGKLPTHVHVQYCGMVPHVMVTQVFSQYHLFLFPTRGENFGHVISESLSAGCPVLTSDQTPWHGMEKQRAGWEVPLSDLERFLAILEACAEMDQADFNAISDSALSFATMYIQSQDASILQAYRELLAGNADENRRRDEPYP
jgi:glycosyltransferase involved in cell wall biosynthesis